MDPSGVNNIYALIAVCVMTLGGMVGSIIYVQRTTGRITSVHDTPTNGSPVSANYVKRLVAEHERDCKVREEIAALRREMNAGFANVSDDFRNLHERLDRAVERGK